MRGFLEEFRPLLVISFFCALVFVGLIFIYVECKRSAMVQCQVMCAGERSQLEVNHHGSDRCWCEHEGQLIMKGFI